MQIGVSLSQVVDILGSVISVLPSTNSSFMNVCHANTEYVLELHTVLRAGCILFAHCFLSVRLECTDVHLDPALFIFNHNPVYQHTTTFCYPLM